MPDHHRVIEFLRDVRQGGSLQSVNDEITHMATAYAELCVHANERLRKCSTFLQQGLRTEAIHLAEESPNLLDLVAQLDLPDPQAWAEFCQNNGLAVPPQLQLDRAAQLNEAYAADQPLEHLLSQHRYLALSRAPVGQRLAVMRRVSQLDPTSPHWEKDIRIFEKARLKELPTEFYAAVKRKDDAAIAALMDEITRQPWYEAPPADLVTAATDAYNRVQRAGVEAELRILIEPLRDAYASRSLQECQALVARWKSAMAAAGVSTVSPELLDEIRPVVAFISEQTKRDEFLKRFREACKAFTKLLDADSPNAQLEAGYSRLKEFNEEIPEDLTRRYLAKRTDRTKDVDRRHRARLMTIAGITVVFILLCLAGVWLFMSASAARDQTQTADTWARQIESSLDLRTSEGLDRAQKQLAEVQKNNPDVARSPKILAAATRITGMKAEFERDRTNLLALKQQVETARAAAATRNTPATSRDDIRFAAATLRGIIQRAAADQRTLAWADTDGSLKSTLDTARETLAQLTTPLLAGVRADIADLRQAVAALPTAISTPEAALDAQVRINDLVTRADTLRALPLLDAPLTTELTEVLADLTARRGVAEAATGIAGALEPLRARAASAAEIQTALRAFVGRYPNDPRTADFNRALQLIPAAQSLEQWHQFTRNLEGNPAAGNEATTKRRVELVNAFLLAHPQLPITADVTRYTEYLTLAGEALADKGTWHNSFESLIASPFMSDLDIMEVSDGRRFYTMGDVKRRERRLNQTITVQFEALELKDPANLTKPITINIDIPPNSPLKVADAPIPAPHKKFVADLAAELKRVDERNWDTFGIDLIERLVKDDKIDPVVKCILLLQAVKTQQAVAGWALGTLYADTETKLARQAPAELPWFDPKRMNENTLKSLKEIVDAIPPAATARQKLADAKTALFKAVAPELLAEGVLLKNDAGEWVIHAKTTGGLGSFPPGAAAWALQPGPPPVSIPTLARIATAAPGKFDIDPAAARGLPEGSVVFITRP